MVLNPIPPLGPAEKRAGLSGGSAAYQPHRPVERGGAGRGRHHCANATLRSSTLLDGKVWNGVDPEGYAASFAIQHKGHEMKPAINTQPRADLNRAGRNHCPAAAAGAQSYAVRRCWLNAALQRLLPPLLGLALLLLGWQLAAIGAKGFPTPLSTLDSALTLFSDPFYRDGPNDMGIGWNVLASLQRVAVGFGLAALAGIPLGFLIGRSLFFARMFNPLIALLRPVSPLAWLPIGLLLFQKAEPASSWTILSALSGRWSLTPRKASGVSRRTISMWLACCSCRNGR